MQVVPVIDVRAGQVVAALGGDRAAYRPIVTPLAPGTSDPVAVVDGLLAIAPFPRLYVADLDGIEGRGASAGFARALRRAHPRLELWIDAGQWRKTEVARTLNEPGVVAVIGSETLPSLAVWRELAATFQERLVLSLDFKGDAFLGPPQLLSTASVWPDRIVAMTLASVGRGAGPDLERVATLKAMAGGRRVYAAGGVRDRADLVALASAGAAGVLVASALHSGKIKAGDLDEITGL